MISSSLSLRWCGVVSIDLLLNSKIRLCKGHYYNNKSSKYNVQYEEETTAR